MIKYVYAYSVAFLMLSAFSYVLEPEILQDRILIYIGILSAILFADIVFGYILNEIIKFVKETIYNDKE